MKTFGTEIVESHLESISKPTTPILRIAAIDLGKAIRYGRFADEVRCIAVSQRSNGISGDGPLSERTSVGAGLGCGVGVAVGAGDGTRDGTAVGLLFRAGSASVSACVSACARARAR